MQGWGWGGAALQRAGQTTEHEKVNAVVVVDNKVGKTILPSHGRRIALEREILKLEKKLRNEIDIRRALERGFRRKIGSLPRVPLYLPPKTREILAEVALLEEEVVKLEHLILHLHQGLYEEALHTLLPPKCLKGDGKMNVTNPEVGENTTSIKSLVQLKNCSSDGRLRPGIKRDSLVAKLLLPIKEREEGDASTLLKKDNSNKASLSVTSLLQKDSNEVGASTLVLKEAADSAILENEKNIEPNRLSEEMVKCLADIYLQLTRPSQEAGFDASSMTSRSTLSSASFSSYSFSKSSPKSSMDISEEFEFRDLYGIFTDSAVGRDVGAYGHYYNITTISFDYSRAASSSSLFKRLSVLVHRLSMVDLQGLTHQQKLAFWINIYNVCMMHAFLEHGIPCSPHKVVALMGKAVMNVGGHLLNALAIEHFMLRLPSHPKQSVLKDEGDKEELRSSYGLEWPEPLVSFALCCGSHSSPAVHVYTAMEIESELETAKKEYLQAAVGITSKKKVLIPKLLVWYMKDFAKDAESLLEWICGQLPSFLRSSVQSCLEMKKSRTISDIIEVMPYDFNFRYLLASHPFVN